ncbi:hypothetical protein Lal_00024632 [Lupinus albus]|nr:hypothetical protein Lal_00024632 [Lupinus albus]
MLKLNLVATAEGKKINPMSHMVAHSIAPNPMFSSSSLMNGCFTGNHQPWNLMGGSSSSRNLMVRVLPDKLRDPAVFVIEEIFGDKPVLVWRDGVL